MEIFNVIKLKKLGPKHVRDPILYVSALVPDSIRGEGRDDDNDL